MQKTGGSTLECATEDQPSIGALWTNMGHTYVEFVKSCKRRCTFGGIEPKVVVMIREPYDERLGDVDFIYS